jgi:hypothetical protein
MDVCVRLFCVSVVLCVGSGLATGWPPVQGVLPTVYRLRNWKGVMAKQRAAETYYVSLLSLFLVLIAKLHRQTDKQMSCSQYEHGS